MNESKSQPSEGLLWVMSRNTLQLNATCVLLVQPLDPISAAQHLAEWRLYGPNRVQKIFRQYDGGSAVFETGKTAISSPSPSPMTCLYQTPGVEQWRHQFQQFNWHQWQCPVIFGDHQLFTNGFTDHTSTNSSAHWKNT